MFLLDNHAMSTRINIELTADELEYLERIKKRLAEEFGKKPSHITAVRWALKRVGKSLPKAKAKK